MRLLSNRKVLAISLVIVCSTVLVFSKFKTKHTYVFERIDTHILFEVAIEKFDWIGICVSMLSFEACFAGYAVFDLQLSCRP